MSNKPTFYAYFDVNVKKTDNRPLEKIGAAWSHQKGKGLTLEITALPLAAFQAIQTEGKLRVVLFEPSEKDQPHVVDAEVSA